MSSKLQGDKSGKRHYDVWARNSKARNAVFEIADGGSSPSVPTNMKTAKLKFDVGLCDKVYKRGTQVEVLDASDPLVQNIFPNIKSNSESKFIAVKFPDRNHATICLAKQIEFSGEVV